MADFQAFLLITLLTWAAVSVSGTAPELSTTTGDTVNIPCLFGEGTLRNTLIEWYYNDSTGHRMILKPVNGDFNIGAEYKNRASLQDDYSTLILTEITVADEGTYHCVVDGLKQTTAHNIRTKLNVFSLRPDTLPVISPCTGADDSSSCRVFANQSLTLTCTLPNVYPVEDTKLIWYKDRKHFSSIHDVTQNDDATTDIIRQIRIYETGNFTCNATYNSATGRENTATSVEAWIIPPAACRPALDVPATPGKNMTSGQIAGMIIGIVLLVGISVAIFTFVLFSSKLKGQRSSRNYELNQVDSSALLPSSTVRRRNEREISDEMQCNLARYVPSYAYDIFSEQLGIEHNQARNILVKYYSDYEKATMECIAIFRARSTRSVADLHEALREANLGGLIVHCY